MKNNPMSKDTFLIQEIDRAGKICVLSNSNGKYSYAVKKTGPLVTIVIADYDVQTKEDFMSIDEAIYPNRMDSLFKYSWLIGETDEINERYANVIKDYLTCVVCKCIYKKF